MSAFKFHGLCPATHTPMHADGSLNLAVVEKQAAHLLYLGTDGITDEGDAQEFVALAFINLCPYGL